MKLRIMSDLHLEFGHLDLEPIGEDVLVLAGDIGSGIQGVEWAIEYADHASCTVIVVLGNHEFYGSRLAAVRRSAFDLASSTTNVRVLDDDVEDVGWNGDRVIFVGGTLWTDYRLNGSGYPEWRSKQVAKLRMNDHRLIEGFSPDHAQAEHERTLRFLRRNVRRPMSTVVVTHYLPSLRSAHEDYRNSTEDVWLNASLASHLDYLVHSSGAKLWIHGHPHRSCDYRIGETRVICNPRGYYPDDLNHEFDPNLMVEV